MPTYKKISRHITLGLLLSSPFALPLPANGQTTSPLSKPPSAAMYSGIKAKALSDQDKVVQEAAETVLDSQKALEAIENGDPHKALRILQEVSGNLDVMLAKYPALELVSANIDTNIVEFEGDAVAVKKAIDQANDFFEDGKIQEARQILDELISEVRITTTGIPLKTFPAAIKATLAYLTNGKTDEAASTLYKALNTLDEVTEVIPLPLLHAEVLLSAAAEAEHKQDLSQASSRAEIMQLTEAAKGQLKLAQLFGYGTKDDYKWLYTAIDEIEDVMFSEKSAAAWSAVKQQLTNLKNKLTFFKK